MIIIKRIFKYLTLTIGVVLLLWGIVVGAIATPEIITPHIVGIAQTFTKSDVSIKSVDLSLFTRFPNITLRIDSLRVTQTRDSIDDLIFARQCRVAIDPVALLSKKIDIKHLSLRDASFYIYVDSLNGPLKTFILPEAEEVESVDTLSDVDLSEYSLNLRRVIIDSTRIVIDDRTKGFYTRIENFGTKMSMDLTTRRGKIDVATGFSNLIVWHKGDLLVKKTSMDLRSDMLFDRDSMLISFDNAQLRINDIDLKTHGTLHRDTIAKGIAVDIKSQLNTPSISEFLALVPPTIIDHKERITTEGAVQFDIDLSGVYSDNSIPVADVTFKVESATAKYESRKLALESVNCDASMHINMNSPTESYADIKSLQINTSDIIDLSFSGHIANIIENPTLDMAIKSVIDFDRFSDVFPLNDGFVCSGTNHSDIKIKCSAEDIQDSNYADLYIDGESTFENFEVSYDANKFFRDSTSTMEYLYMQTERGHMLFGDKLLTNNNSRTLRSQINFLGLGYKTKSGEYVDIRDIELMVGANFDRKRSKINGVGIRGVAKNANLGVDTLFNASLNSSDISIIVTPKSETHNATLKGSISSQELTLYELNYNSNINLSAVNMDITLDKLDTLESERKWDMSGSVAFSNLIMYSDLFPLEVNIPNTSISINNQGINLTNAELTLGSSEFLASGHINNLVRKLLIDPKESISGELYINAPLLNISELIEASNKSLSMFEDQLTDEESTIEAENQTDSLSDMFLVPRGVDFKFDLNIGTAIFEEAIVESIEGHASINRGVLGLEKIKLLAIGAEATGSLNYRNISRTGSNVAADMSLKSVDINRIGELYPSINSMLPMLESFEGIVDFDMKINTNLKSNNEPDYTTLYSAMQFKGKDLVLMDSESFAMISKKMMFKNKERNLVDSLEVYALVDGTKIDILPFPISMDRYSAIIGGSQSIDPVTFDVDYKYNISIIKSPLPFKAGVDFWGNLDDFDFKVTSAKLKKTDFDLQRSIYNEYRNSIDELSIALQQQVDNRRKEMQERRKQQRIAQEQSEQETEDIILAEEQEGVE